MKLVIEVSEKIYDTIMADVMPTREQMSVIVTRIYQGIPYEERPHGEWIPCSERLPEESGEYYVSGGDKVWICSFLIIPTFKGGWCNNVSNPVVEAWMPLPEPYEKEGDMDG